MNFAEGLSSEEAAIRLKCDGPNILVPQEVAPWFGNLLVAVKDPMALMLLGLALLYAFTGERLDAAVLFIALVPLTLMDVFFNWRTDASLRTLRKSAPSSCFVVRDGKTIEISSTLLVMGDLLAFEEGLILPADGLIESASELEFSEASLTGESVPIPKLRGESFYAGASVVHGRGLGRVTATGRATKFGATAATLKELKTETSPLLRQIHRMIRWFFALAVVLSVTLYFAEVLRGQSWIEALKSAATLAMSAIPEEFTIVYGFFLSLAAYHLSRQGVLVRSSPAVETLGRIDVLCTDKTGTLTTGRFSLERIIPMVDIDAQEMAIMLRSACEPQITDTLERAIEAYLQSQPATADLGNLIHDYAFDPARKIMCHVWKQPNGSCVIAMKGAWEGVRQACRPTSQLEAADLLVKKLAGEAYRILALASDRRVATGIREKDEQDLILTALLLFADPVRPSVAEAVRVCQTAGIEIKLVTGDHLLTAVAVADRVGIQHGPGKAFSGRDLDTMSPERRQEAFRDGRIFGRVTGEHKMELVQTLKRSGSVVAMIGDGVNDLTALKSADVGVSMGETATLAARNTAKLILFREDFSKLVSAIMEGRQTFSNLKKSFTYLIAFHIPVVVLSMLGPLTGSPPIWLPVHIVLFEFLVHPFSAFAFLSRDPGGIQRRKSSGRLVSPGDSIWAAAFGCTLSLFGALLYYMYLDRGVETARSMAVLFFIFGNLAVVALTLADSLWRERRRFLLIAGLAIFFCFVLFAFESCRRVFHLHALSLGDATFGISSAILYFLVFQVMPGRERLFERGMFRQI